MDGCQVQVHPSIPRQRACRRCCLTLREVKADGQRLIHEPPKQRGGPLQTDRRHVLLESAQLRLEARFPPVQGQRPQLVMRSILVMVKKRERPSAIKQRVDVRKRFDCRARDER